MNLDDVKKIKTHAELYLQVESDMSELRLELFKRLGQNWETYLACMDGTNTKIEMLQMEIDNLKEKIKKVQDELLSFSESVCA